MAGRASLERCHVAGQPVQEAAAPPLNEKEKMSDGGGAAYIITDRQPLPDSAECTACGARKAAREFYVTKAHKLSNACVACWESKAWCSRVNCKRWVPRTEMHVENGRVTSVCEACHREQPYHAGGGAQPKFAPESVMKFDIE